MTNPSLPHIASTWWYQEGLLRHSAQEESWLHLGLLSQREGASPFFTQGPSSLIHPSFILALDKTGAARQTGGAGPPTSQGLTWGQVCQAQTCRAGLLRIVVSGGEPKATEGSR